MTGNQRVKVVCTVEQFEHFWVEFDVSDWGMGVYVTVYDDLTLPQVLTEFYPQYCVAWHITNSDGTAIAHPGKSRSADAWRNIWKQFDVATSRALFQWLWVSVLSAVQEAMALPPKSAGDDPGDSAGEGDPA
jgi:hypothetical protein